jgi:hypothetical protein
MRQMMKATIAAGLTMLGMAGAVWYLCAGETPAHPQRASVAIAAPPQVERAEPEAEPRRPSAPTLFQTVSISAAPPLPAPALDEPSMMSTLRALGDSEPQHSLALAREGNARFPGSPDAAERQWYVCKSLVNLENFYDARDEARSMVAKYPDTPWTLDVARHLLTNPLDLPGDPAP